MWIHICGFHLFYFTTQGGRENLFHTPTSITKQLRIEAILRQMEMLMVTAHKQESHICEIMKWVGSCYMNSMSVGMFSWLSFCRSMSQRYFQFMGEACALPYTLLLARGCRNSPKVASSLPVTLSITCPGGCRILPDISLPGHFTTANSVVGEMQKGRVKIFGKPNMRGTWDTHTCSKILLPGIQVLPFL